MEKCDSPIYCDKIVGVGRVCSTPPPPWIRLWPFDWLDSLCSWRPVSVRSESVKLSSTSSNSDIYTHERFEKTYFALQKLSSIVLLQYINYRVLAIEPLGLELYIHVTILHYWDIKKLLFHLWQKLILTSHYQQYKFDNIYS